MNADPRAAKVAEQWQHDSPLIHCRFDPTGRFVFATAEDFSIARWDLATKQKIAFKSHDSWVGDLAFTPSGDVLISAGYDDTLTWWPAAAEQPEPLRKVKAHEGWIRALAMHPDGQWLASAGNDRTVRLWNVADGSLVRELAGHQKHVYSLQFHPDGQLLLSGDLEGKVHQWDVASGALMRSFDAKALWSYNAGQQVDYGGVRSIALSADKKQLACGGLHQASNPLGAVNDPLVLLFDWESGQGTKSLTAGDLKGIIWRVCWHPQGFLIGASGGSGGGFLLFWTADQDKDFHRLQLPNIVRGMDLHPDGVRIATAHHDRHLRITTLA